MSDQINDPGTRQKGNATVIQFKRRSEQLDGIAGIIKGILSTSFRAVIGEDGQSTGMRLTSQEVHQIKGYCKQLGIIADELAKAGK